MLNNNYLKKFEYNMQPTKQHIKNIHTKNVFFFQIKFILQHKIKMLSTRENIYKDKYYLLNE